MHPTISTLHPWAHPWGRRGAFNPGAFGNHTHTWANHYWHRPPSRFFWFLTGAVSAGWFIRCQRDASDQGGWKPFCYRPGASFHEPQAPVTDTQNNYNQQAPQQRQWQWKRWEYQYPPPPQQQSSAPPSRPSIPNPWDRPWGRNLTPHQQEKLWQEEMERVQNVAKQASDAMSDISEQTLDSVVKAVETLTAKLNAHQEARQRTERQLEKEMEDLRKNPPRLV